MIYPRSTEHRILRAIPLLLLAIITLGMSLVGYDSYKRSHMKPKPSAMTPAAQAAPTTAHEGHPCKRLDGGWWVCGDPNAVWFNCNAGMAVTNIGDCPQHKSLDRKGAHD